MFKAVKDRYGDLSTLAQTSAHGAIRGFRNQSSSLGSKVAGGAAAHAATGPLAIPLAIAAGAGHEAANHRGAAGLARTLSNASQGNMLLAPAVTGSLSPWESLLGLNPDEEK
jgi:hypothetical protein